MSRRTSRTTWAVLGAILLAQVGLLAWHHARATAEPHRVPVAVEGPAAVSQSIAHRLNALPGDPLDAVVVAEGDDPRAGVRNGGVVAALAVDPSTPANVLTSALFARYRSRENESFADKLLSAMRFGFGGHLEMPR